MTKTEKALTCFEKFNCCQSVLVAFANEIGLSESHCLKLGSGFGGGMNCGETCGAVTGAYMVLGMKLGRSISDPESKTQNRQNVTNFNDKFLSEYESLICKELLGVDISTPEGKAIAEEKKLFELRCPSFIRLACRLVEEDLQAEESDKD